MAPKIDTWTNKDDDITAIEGGDEDNVLLGAKSSVPEIKQNQVAIDGIIYDLDSFDHPGGESIKMFGGNDVSVMYRMIHPRHTGEYHAKKMKQVGTIENYNSEYQFGSAFEQELKREVFKIVRPGQERGTSGFLARACFYLALYFTLQVRRSSLLSSDKLHICPRFFSLGFSS